MGATVGWELEIIIFTIDIYFTSSGSIVIKSTTAIAMFPTKQ